MCYHFHQGNVDLMGTFPKLPFVSYAEFERGCSMSLNYDYFQYFSTEKSP